MLGKRGFTLVELIVTIAVVAVLSVMAVPPFKGMIAKRKLDVQARELSGIFSDARATAVTLRKKVAVKFETGTNDATTYYWLPKYSDIKLRVNESGASAEAVPKVEFLLTGLTTNGREVMIPNPAYNRALPTDMTTTPPTNPEKVTKLVDLVFVLCDTKLYQSKIITISKTGTTNNIQSGTCS